MIRYKDVNIPNPCSINYDSLPYNEVKRLCNSCEKHVYDFRKKDDTYFSTIFKEEKNVCGIFYEDQLSNKKSNFKKSAYTSLVVKLTGLVLFIRSFFISHDINASDYYVPEVSQIIPNDSVGVRTVYKKVSSRIRHEISVYVNNELIGTSFYPVQGLIYLPDSLKPDDKIKIRVTASNSSIKTKTYRFKYSEAETITIKITKRMDVRLFKRRVRVGCPSQFW